jgi:D-beta-D-heptose 7-phosphate kinase/D-beta-D-heptose 1-phosphate adenosyltransferase
MSTLLNKLAGFGDFTVLVVGDFMLDEFLYGDAERLSPDAPVPVLRSDRLERTAGGSANVAACVQGLGGRVHCCGVVGDDEAGVWLRQSLQGDACNIDGLLTDPDRPTTVKRSLIGLAQHRHPQKMFRVDVETTDPIPAAIEQQLLSVIEARIESVDIVCLEDYGKGVCSESLCQAVIELARAAGTPVYVDPASSVDWTRYAGATTMTPNRTELEQAIEHRFPDTIPDSGPPMELMGRLGLESMVLTLDRHGSLLLRGDQEPLHVPTTARSVYDVTGAGDMVLAALAAGRANGLSWLEAVEFANAAAGLEVEVFGAQPIPLSRVRREIMLRQAPPDRTVRTLDELATELAVHREAGQRIVLTNGCFDVVHAGHVAYLREAANLGDVLVVGVNVDEEVAKQKGPERPVYPLKQRLDILSEFRCIDYLVAFPEPTAHELIRAVEPDIYVKGGDYRPEEINEHDLVTELGIELHVLGHRPGLSSTSVIERMADG